MCLVFNQGFTPNSGIVFVVKIFVIVSHTICNRTWCLHKLFAQYFFFISIDMEIEHVHSFIFPSITNLTAIVRVGWTSKKIFMWQRFHRVVDILNVWFTVHGLPHEYGKNNSNGTNVRNEPTILFFRSVLYLLSCTVTKLKPWSQCTEFEQQFFKCDTNDTMIVDATTTQWIFSLLTETPSCVFGAYFHHKMKTYKDVAVQTWSNIYYHAFPFEDYGIDLFLCDYYGRSQSQWPVSYQTAHDLSNMNVLSTKRRPKINLCLKRVRFTDDENQQQKRLCVAK